MGKFIKNKKLLNIINGLYDTYRSKIDAPYIRRATAYSTNYDIIQGEKFVALADNRSIYYRPTHEVNEFFMHPPDADFVLISHNSDGKLSDNPSNGDADVTKMPENLIRWFAQNVDYEHEKIEPIPIGLENCEWFPRVRKIETLVKMVQTKKERRNLMYINHNVKTNPTERTEPYEIFENKGWCTLERRENNCKYEHFVRELYNHKFVLSPEGNGIDTHRTWEALYLNTIPIVKRNVNNSHYQDLPICFVDDWVEITEEFLYREYERISSASWSLQKLKFSYWAANIRDSI